MPTDVTPPHSPTRIELFEPRVDGQQVHFRWRCTPQSPWYRAERFSLTFPESVPLDGVSEDILWRAFLLCLHPQWLFMRPCVIELPIRLAPGEAEFWQRMLKNYAQAIDPEPQALDGPELVSFIEGFQRPERRPVEPGSTPCVAAFSGGKDSLAQVGLLMELGERPLLVTVTSPLRDILDHKTVHRERSLAGIQELRGLELVEVHSDIRPNWRNKRSRQQGWPVSINEVSDTFVYLAALLITAAARGGQYLMLASENEVSQTVRKHDVLRQHHHFMYSLITQGALDAWLRPTGLHYGSLNYALHSSQVQGLVSQRYPDLRPLQFSCWRTTEEQKACGTCWECRRLAFSAVAHGGQVADLGIDLKHLLEQLDTAPFQPDAIPFPVKRTTACRFREQLARDVFNIPKGALAAGLAEAGVAEPAQALAVFTQFHAQLEREFPRLDTPLGYRHRYLEHTHERFRAPLEQLFETQFQTRDAESYEDELADQRERLAWLIEPMTSSAAA